MADEFPIDRKVESSRLLANALVERGLPLLAAYWEFLEDRDRWALYLVPYSSNDERKLLDGASGLLVEMPYRSMFSLSDPIIDSHQIERARALASYLRDAPDLGRPVETTFTGGHYFERVVPIYFSPELMPHLRVA